MHSYYCGDSLADRATLRSNIPSLFLGRMVYVSGAAADGDEEWIRERLALFAVQLDTIVSLIFLRSMCLLRMLTQLSGKLFFELPICEIKAASIVAGVRSRRGAADFVCSASESIKVI